MVDWLAVWGIGKASWSVSRLILEDLAKDVVEDAAKSYVGKCFQNVFSVIHKEPLAKATGRAIKELLELIEAELIRAEVDDDELSTWVDGLDRFIKQDEVRQAIASLFLDPDYHLDPQTLAHGWQQLESVKSLPDDFSWRFVAKRFTAKVNEIRLSSKELQETFRSLSQTRDSTALQELTGLPPDFNLDAYREALVERYGSLDFASLEVTGAYYNEVRLWSVFEPQAVRECHEYDLQLLEVPKEHLQRLVDAGELDAEQLAESEKLKEKLAESEKLQEQRRQAYVNQPMRPVLDIVDHASDVSAGSRQSGTGFHQRIVILGDPGSGKSSLLQFLALNWARTTDVKLRHTQPLPLLIELREYSRWECTSGKSFPKYLHEGPVWHRLNQQTLKHLLNLPNRVILLLDGLDEVFDLVEREEVVNAIHNLSNEYKHVRIVLTSRVVGYKPKRLRGAGFRHFMLQDLDDEKIGHFLDKWHDVTFAKPEEAESKKERLAKAIENSKSIAQLAGNPLLLTMMAILNRSQKLPDDRVDLYQQCSRLLLHQWDVERTLGDFTGLSAEIGLREKMDILRIVAYAMQTRLSDESRANYIDGTKLMSLIEEYLHNELRFDQARAMARALIEQLRTRNFILCYLGADSYAFIHRTFLEYFCAAEIVHRFNVAKALREQDLISLFDAHCRDDDWREVLRLICGQIDEQFVGSIVEYLVKQTDLKTWDGRTSLPEIPLAIGCLSEVRSGSQFNVAAAKLLSAASFCFLHGEKLSEAFVLDLIGVANEVGVRWSAKSTMEFTGQAPEGRGYHAEWGWPHFVAAVFGERSWIEQLAYSESANVRQGSLEVLTEKWPDKNTRELLSQRAVRDDHYKVRGAALQALVAKWPDDTTRKKLAQWAVQDDDEYPRSAALRALAANWPDETTRQLIALRSVRDYHGYPRGAALQTLASNWPDATTRELLTHRAVQDKSGDARSAAFLALAETWPDESTRDLLSQRAVEDAHPKSRGKALQALAETWPDETTRELLAERAVEDDEKDTRGAALHALAEQWPDETTRELLAERAVEDDEKDTRGAALHALAEQWPDETTRDLLARRTVDVSLSKERRSEHASALAQLHSEFGGILLSKYLNGVWPYLDPLEPVPRDHIERAGKKAGIFAEDIEEQLAALSAHMGWDLTVGAKSRKADRGKLES